MIFGEKRGISFATGKERQFFEKRSFEERFMKSFKKMSVTILASLGMFAFAMSLMAFQTGAQNSHVVAKKKSSRKPASIPTWRPLMPNGTGCNYGAIQGSSGVLMTVNGCPVDNSPGLVSPGLLINNAAYYFAYHTEGEKEQIASIICQQVKAGARAQNIGAGYAYNMGGVDLTRFQYVDTSLAPKPYNMQSDHDLQVIGALICVF